MKELIKRVVVTGVAMLSVACLAGCPKNSPENEGQIQAPTTANNPDYEQKRQEMNSKAKTGDRRMQR